MAIQSFERVEKKYIITTAQKNKLLKILQFHMGIDPFCIGGKTYKIQNIYYDTEDESIISHSISKPDFKQKLRARKYQNKQLFLELKKKCNGVVTKRRVKMNSRRELDNFIHKHVKPVRESFVDNQVIEEIAYFLECNNVKENVYISYERLGYFDKEDKEFRITFDNAIHTSRTSFAFDKVKYDESLLKINQHILEIKSTHNYPLWLSKALSELKIFRTSYSKYGEEYKRNLLSKKD